MTASITEKIAQAQAHATEGIAMVTLIGDARQILQQLPDGMFDCIYHDAFSPKRQPELWTQTLFEQYARILNPHTGTVLTYSAAAGVRKALENVGLQLYKLENSLSKPGTMASKHAQDNQLLLSDLERELIACRSGIPYEDNETLTLDAETIVANRQAAHAASTLPGANQIHKRFGGHIRQFD